MLGNNFSAPEGTPSLLEMLSDKRVALVIFTVSFIVGFILVAAFSDSPYAMAGFVSVSLMAFVVWLFAMNQFNSLIRSLLVLSVLLLPLGNALSWAFMNQQGIKVEKEEDEDEDEDK